MNNGHSARRELGQRQALRTALTEAVKLLEEIASGGWTEKEQAEDWYDRYDKFKEVLGLV